MSKDLYTKLCRPETLRIAANYVFDDQKDDFVPDVFRHQDYIYNLDENLTRLCYSHLQNRSVPRASIIWLARAVNVVRPAALRLHIDRARSAMGRRLGRHAGNLHVWFQDLTLNPNFAVWWENWHPVPKSETKLPERPDCEAANRFLIKVRRCAAQQK